ncbi:MAG: UvrD-helicase domain-containing protein [Thermoanaerobaculaceae bacterium]|nr:UvrD-helicase domain-containing protein [Thermoanaerobaculaceae bacterium]
MRAGAATAELVAEDARARRAAQTEFTRPLVLEAGAGTGKTTALVARVVAWATGQGWREAVQGEESRSGGGGGTDAWRIAARVLDGIVAVTFTEAAAAEMAARVGEVLGQLASLERPPFLDDELVAREGEDVAGRAAALLERLDRLQVTTIHSYCRRLLAAWPYEAGIHPDFAVDADGRITARVVQAAVEEGYAAALASGADAQLLALAAAGVGPQEVAEAVEELVQAGLPAAALAEDPLAGARGAQVVAELEGALAAFAQRGGAQLATASKSTVAREVVEALEELHRRVASLEGSERERAAGAAAAVAACVPAAVRKRLRQWAKGGFGQREEDALGAGREVVRAAAAAVWGLVELFSAFKPEFLDAARRVGGPLVHTVRERLRAQGALTFNDLLSGAVVLLRRHPQVAERERARLRQLVVDEFQDTDRVQCEIFRILALEGPDGERPGLFVVGDPKQSIYGWRSADLEAYEAFVRDVVAAGGEVMRLSVNYRSLQPVLDEVARCLAPVMTAEPGVQPAFQPLVAWRREGEGGGAAGPPRVEFWVSWVPDAAGKPVRGGTGEALALEARAVARDIRTRSEAGEVELSRVGVLLRAMTDVEGYLAALREEGVPYVVDRDRSYYRRREVVDATSLVRAVVDPADHVALVGWLRSPCVGVPDAAWLPLWRRGFPALVTRLGTGNGGVLVQLEEAVRGAVEELPTGVPGLERVRGWEESLLAALSDLEVLRRSFRSEPVGVFLERLRQLTLLEPTAAACYLGHFRVANLERFFALLRRILDTCGDNPAVLVRELRAAVREEAAEPEEKAVLHPRQAVQVMSIHRAKGLDFDHVYLVQTHRGVRRDVASANDAEAVGGRWEYRLFGVPSSGWGKVVQRRQRRATAELVRTAYVALTRARDRLVVVGMLPERPRTGEPNSLAYLLGCRQDYPDLAQLFSAAAQTPTGEIEEGGVRWVFPVLAAAAVPAGKPRTPGSRGRSLGEVEAAVASLAVRRREAARRMARPFSTPASAQAHRLLEEGEAMGSAAGELPGAEARRGALLLGTAVHRFLEAADFSAPLHELATAGVRQVEAELARLLAGQELVVARERARELFRRVAASPLGQRLEAIARGVLAREMPILLAPPLDGGAVGYVAGSVDLLYRDPAGGGLVVADYKTDEVETEEEIATRAALYRPQGAAYAQAVAAALGLAKLPRFELWFLWPGRVVEVPLAGEVSPTPGR